MKPRRAGGNRFLVAIAHEPGRNFNTIINPA